MRQELHHTGEYVIVKNHKIHIYRAGNKNGPKLAVEIASLEIFFSAEEYHQKYLDF